MKSPLCRVENALAGDRTSAPLFRSGLGIWFSQELPPGCGPPCPSLSGIFGRDMDEEELETARDGSAHLQTSQASRRLTALSSAAPKELTSHVKVR